MKLRNLSLSAPSRTTLGIAVVVAALGITATPGLSAIVAWLPDVVKTAPPVSAELDQFQSDTQISAFEERQCFQLPNAIQADHGWIAAGTLVSCDMLHTDPETMAVVLQGKVRFDDDIIDVISTSALLDNSDAECGAGVIYPAAGVEPFRGLEAFQPNDRYRLLDPRTLELQVDVPSYSDQARVITRCCPEGQVCD